MSDKPRIYVDACPFIDLAKHIAKVSNTNDRENDVWHLKQLIIAARDGHLDIFTSSITISECVGVKKNNRSPNDEVKRFYDNLFLSGKSGITIVQASTNICEKARNFIWAKNLKLKPLDSIHYATAFIMRCDELLTQDGNISKNASKLSLFPIRVIPPSNTQLLPNDYRQKVLFNEEKSGNKKKR